MARGSKRKLLVIVGPTCVGKTALSLELARKTGAHIISADSRQVYKYMDIGTDKVSEGVRHQIPHYMIDVVEPPQDFNVYDYQERVYEILESLSRDLPLIMVGGTGLYIRAVLRGFKLPPRDLEIREQLELELAERGFEALLEELRELDPESALKVAQERNPRRLVRYLEVVRATGRPLRYFWEERRAEAEDIEPIMIALYKPREKLYRDIEDRVDDQVRRGLIGEVSWLVWRYGFDLKAFETLGYQEIIKAFKGELSLGKAINLIKRNTKRFAKRQFTWFKREPVEKWFEVTGDFKALAKTVLDYLKGRWP